MTLSPGGRPADASPVGTPGGQQNWVDQVGGLPSYIRMVAHALIRKGQSKNHAIATAVNMMRKWAAGADGVRPQVQAAAVKALAEWEAKKGAAHSLSTPSGYVDAAELLDLAVPAPVMEWALEAYDRDLPLDLARDYVRDPAGKFASDGRRDSAIVNHDVRRGATIAPAGRHVDRDKVHTGPRKASDYTVRNADDVRSLVRRWHTVPLVARPALKRRLLAIASRTDARLRTLVEGLGDGDGTKEKGEGAGGASKRGNARDWLAANGYHLSAEQLDRFDSEVLDLATPDAEVLDLAPGDYQPPYDWKHGYIPITPAAALSKAGKGPHAGKGRTRTPKGAKLNPSTPIVNRKPAGTKAVREASMDDLLKHAKELPPGKNRDAVDAELRRRNVSPATVRQAAGRKSLPESHPVGKVVEVGPTNVDGIVTGHTRDGKVKVRLDKGGAVTAFDPDQVKPTTGRTQRADAAKTNALRRTDPVAVAIDDPRVSRQARDQLKRLRDPDGGEWTAADKAQTLRFAAYGLPEGDPLRKQLTDMADAAQGATVKGGRAAQEGAAGKPRKNLPGGGSYPTKPDGSPDYGAMSAEQAATIRAKLAGRGVGDRVEVDGKSGTVKSVSTRGTTVDFDDEDEGTMHIGASTPRHGRMKPAPDPKARIGADKPGGQGTTSMSGKSRPRSAPYDTDAATRTKAEDERLLRGLTDEVLALNIKRYEKTEAGRKSKTLRDLKAEKARRAEGKAPAGDGLPDGQRVAYNGRPSDGTGVVVGRRSDSQGTILEVRDDKDGKTYEWAPDQVKPHDTTKQQSAGSEKPVERASSGSTNPDAPIRIEHTPDGTLVHGTSREDAAAIKSVGGFKWSRNLNAWYLPRTWGESTRERRVKQLEDKLGGKAGVDRTTGPRKSAAERDADTRARAAARAERMDSRAEKRSAEADRRFEASDLREEKSGIPLGQPILVGHHSERKHRRALERAHQNLGKGVEAQRDAERAQEAAERARRTASGAESKVTTGNRIKKLEAEQRDIQRKLDGSSSQLSGPASGAYAERLRRRAAEVADDLEFNRGKLAAAGGVPSADTVSPGDFIKVAGTWYPVTKSNSKSATVPSPMGSGTRTAAWHKVQEHRKAGEVSREEVARMVQDVARPFPYLADALRKAAPPKRDGDSAEVADARKAGRSAGSSEGGQREGLTSVSNDGNTLAWMQRTTNAQREAMAASKAASDESRTAKFKSEHPVGTEVTVSGKAATVVGHSAAGFKVKFTESGRETFVNDVRRTQAAPGGITESTARRMSDDQLERAMRRLMADGTYSGPAYAILEAELNRRDKARAEGNGRRR